MAERADLLEALHDLLEGGLQLLGDCPFHGCQLGEGAVLLHAPTHLTHANYNKLLLRLTNAVHNITHCYTLLMQSVRQCTIMPPSFCTHPTQLTHAAWDIIHTYIVLMQLVTSPTDTLHFCTSYMTMTSSY